MRRTYRLAILFTSLVAAAAWAALGGNERRASSVEVVAAVAPQRDQQSSAASPEEPQIPARPALEAMRANPFSVDAPAAPSPEASVPARPSAPPLPYRFAGRVHIGDAVEVYLAKGDEVFTVKKGDTLDGEYRVQAIGRSEMTFLHLASKTHQKLEYSPPIVDNADTAVAATPAPQRRAQAQSKDNPGG
jgi:hypothetical protein